jgi:histidine triad (HIT) family protein
MSYDDNIIFAKILREEIPCNTIYEDKFCFVIHDINPQKPPKKWLDY